MVCNFKIAILTSSQGLPWRVEDSCFASYENLDDKIKLMGKDLSYYRTLKDGDGNFLYDGVKLSVTELKPRIRENFVLKIYHNLLSKAVIFNNFIDFKIEENEEL